MITIENCQSTNPVSTCGDTKLFVAFTFEPQEGRVMFDYNKANQILLGGKFRVTIEPMPEIKPIELTDAEQIRLDNEADKYHDTKGEDK